MYFLTSHSKQIKVSLVGGLGNQLFCFFAGYFVSARTGIPLTLDVSDILNKKSAHNVSIESFKLPGKFVYKKESGVGYLYRRLAKRVKRFLGINFQHSYFSDVVGYDPNLEFITHGLKLNGYFQTYRYYQPFSDLFRYMELREPSSRYLQVKNQITANPSTVIHVRRGDYVNLSEKFGLLGKEYYRESFNKVSNLNPHQNVYVFSDDVNIAKELLIDIVPSNTWWEDGKLNSAECLSLMTLADSIVIANSTFSWWGAMLGGEKIVIAPTKWFRNQEDPTDLYPPNWLTVTSSWI